MDLLGRRINRGVPQRQRSCFVPAPRLTKGVNQMRPLHLVPPALLFVCLFGSGRAWAQPAGARVEVGAHAAVLRLDGFSGGTSTTNGGLGGRVSFDLTNWMTLEGEVNF